MQGKELQVAKKRVGRYPKEFRRVAVERLKNCGNIMALSRSWACIDAYCTNGETSWIRLKSQKNRRRKTTRIHTAQGG